MPSSPSRSKSACMKRRNSGISISNQSSNARANPGVFSSHDVVARVGQRASRPAQRLRNAAPTARRRPGPPRASTTATRIGAATARRRAAPASTTGRADRAAPSPRSPSRTSRTERASGPCTDINCAEIVRSAFAVRLYAGTRPNDGRSPASPVQIRRIAHRAGDVVAVRERRDARRHRRRRAAAASRPACARATTGCTCGRESRSPCRGGS